VTCTLCDTVVFGGIKRLKQHLAGGYADTKMCLKTTTEIRKEMRDYLQKKTRGKGHCSYMMMSSKTTMMW
jgi:hypothetical protein